MKQYQPKYKKDSLGARIGTITSRVNAVMLKRRGWMTVEEIAQAAGVKVHQAQMCLYHSVYRGTMERKKSIEYKVTKKQ